MFAMAHAANTAHKEQSSNKRHATKKQSKDDNDDVDENDKCELTFYRKHSFPCHITITNHYLKTQCYKCIKLLITMLGASNINSCD